jgi:hypothetical protein
VNSGVARGISSSLCVGSIALLAACTHSDAFITPAPSVQPPFSTGPDVQLTFNPDQNYWPTWTQDGRGILYAFVDQESAIPSVHRCIGLLPAAGGSRIWQLCDNRAVRNDSVASYSAFALDSTGRLLLVEAMSGTGFASSFPFRIRLQLTDTATPSVRTTLLTLPVTVDGTPITWLSEITWTGPNSFLALGQQFETTPHCYMCQCQPCPTDSIFADSGGVVVRGTIAGGQLTLKSVAGTEHATGFSSAENGATIAFTIKFRQALFTVPASGGAPVPDPATIPVDTTAELVGVSCKGSTCMVAKDAISIFYNNTAEDKVNFAYFFPRPMELHRVSLNGGTDEVILSNTDRLVYATPQISPISGDVVFQRGGVWGHLQTFATPGISNGELHLLKGMVP